MSQWHCDHVPCWAGDRTQQTPDNILCFAGYTLPAIQNIKYISHKNVTLQPSFIRAVHVNKKLSKVKPSRQNINYILLR